MIDEPDDDGRFVLEVRQGWRHMRLAPMEDQTWDEEMFVYLEWLEGRVFEGHRPRCRRCGQSLLVSIAPPDADQHLARLDDILGRLLGAVIPDDEEDDAAELN